MCQSTEFLSLSRRNQKRLRLDSDLLAILPSLFPSFLFFFSSIFLSFCERNEKLFHCIVQYVQQLNSVPGWTQTQSHPPAADSWGSRLKWEPPHLALIFWGRGVVRWSGLFNHFAHNCIRLPFQLYMDFLLLVLSSLHQFFCIPATFVHSILFECELDLGSFS